MACAGLGWKAGFIGAYLEPGLMGTDWEPVGLWELAATGMCLDLQESTESLVPLKSNRVMGASGGHWSWQAPG